MTIRRQTIRSNFHAVVCVAAETESPGRRAAMCVLCSNATVKVYQAGCVPAILLSVPSWTRQMLSPVLSLVARTL